MKRGRSDIEEEGDGYGQLGIIECVHLRNFMCHDNLSFDFDPHMNFIVGRNGSGKSAVLTGIILALGGKSGATGRYSNIKGFIKTGKSSATVSVTLKNCGPDAYKPEEFGKKIIVERHFTSEGISTYKLKSHGGRIISTSKEELTNILNVMDIQIENPTTVLTQEISRNFLLSKNSKSDKLFQLFYKGTGLGKVHDDYNKALLQKNETEEELEKKKAILPDMEKDIKKLKSVLQKSTKVTELKKELLWAIVNEFERRRDESKEALDKVKKDFVGLKAKLDLYQKEVVNLQQSLNTAIADKRTSKDKMDDIRNDIMELNKKRSSLASEVRQIQGACSSHEREVAKFSSEISSLENIINEIQMKNQNDLNEDKLQHEMSVNNLKKQVYDKSKEIKDFETMQTQLREVAASLQQKVDAFHAEIQEITYEMKNIAREKQQLTDGMVNRINVFGAEMVNILQDIKRAANSRMFTVEPKGPIGMFLNVKEPQWNFAVQECLKSAFLRSFICNSHQDTEVLTKIIKKHCQRLPPSIITTKFVSKVYDVSSHKTVCEFPTVLDMLDISDPVVTNCLIDQKQIENILLIADQNEACRVMLHKPPRHCRFAYTPNGDQYCHTPYRNYSCRNQNQICMLKTVNEDDIRKKNQDLQNLQSAKQAKNADKEDLIRQQREKEREIIRICNEITDLKIKQKHLVSKLKEEENSYEEPKNINCLQSDLEKLQKEKKYQEEQFVSTKETFDEQTEELRNLDKKITEFQRALQVESRNFHALSERAADLDNKKEKMDSTIKKIGDQLRQIEPVLKENEKTLSNDEATVKTATERATNSCARIETRRSPDTIRQILKETELFVQQQRNCDQETLLKDYADKVNSLNKSKSELERLEKINRRLNSMLAHRFREFRKTCTNASITLTCCFTLLLKENNFTGRPEIDFDNQTLEILAQPEKTGSKPGEPSNLAQLSGGERSYVTIAFLLSLWDRIHMPFRILDEYDVFMDSNNRHLSIHLLVNTANANKNIQYIFLSPLELPDIKNSEHVKVHKMPAPRK